MMNTQQALALRDNVRAIAQASGEAVLGIYRQDFSVELKDDRSPLTEADRAAHRLICAGLETLTPRLPVVSEESPLEAPADRRQWRRYWLVDPLDGTKEFVKRNDEFTVNIALIADHAPVLGVVLAPALGWEYSGVHGIGAWSRRAAGAGLEPVRVTPNARQPLRVVGSRSHPSAELSGYLGRLGEYELQSMGSSLKICLVADGQADLYPRFGPTSEWDTAAAQAILESAGGCMMNLAGRPLRYNTKDDLVNPYFVAFGDPKRDWLAAVRHE